VITEESILEGCRSGKRWAQRQLYDKYSSEMYSVCLRYSRDRDEAEDLLQDGFIRVFEHISDFRKEGSLVGWIKRIMINNAVNHYKKINRIPIHEDIAEINETEIIGTDQDNETNPVAPELLMDLINSLPQGYRMVFNLYVFEGYSHKEISEWLSITESTSKTQLLKARKWLRKKISNPLLEKNHTIYNGKH
jgi:RNA polymerase sigma-70 factor (ECF subfamily)